MSKMWQGMLAAACLVLPAGTSVPAGETPADPPRARSESYVRFYQEPVPEGVSGGYSSPQAGAVPGAAAGQPAAPRPATRSPYLGAIGSELAQPPAGAGPGAAAPSFDFGAAAAGAAPSAGLGGGLGGPAGALSMIGDQAPIFRLPRPFPPIPPQPPRPPVPRPFFGQLARKSEQVLPWVRGFKIADNVSPIPQDRVFFTFNYFNNTNYAVNGRIGSPLSDISIYRYQLGFEKTFLGGDASIGVRDSINTLTGNSRIPGLGGTSTSMGDLSVYSKFVLWQNWEETVAPVQAGPSRLEGGLVSGGLAVTVPTGPGGFAGSPLSTSFRNTQLQPFLGYFRSWGDLYVQGFEAINVPLDSRDVTMLFHDVGVGYFYYRAPEPTSLVSAASATFEVHVNNPLNHRHPFSVNDLAGTADVVDFTYGSNFFLGQRSLLTLAMVTPVTGPRPFDFEVVALFNVYFGRSGNARRLTTPPVIGN